LSLGRSEEPIVIEIVFVLRGRRIDLDEVEDARERAILREIERSIVERVGALRCQEHGAFPRLTATGDRADALEFALAGCCQDLLDRTAARLGPS
jgi:hypothetical protein